MRLEELYKLNNKVITDEELDILFNCDLVENMDNLGPSSEHPGMTWYVVTFANEESINVYI